MGFRKFCAAVACVATLALPGCQTTDSSAQRPTAQAPVPAPGASQAAAAAPAAQPNVRFVNFLQDSGVTGRLGEVAPRSTTVAVPGANIVSRAPIAGSGWQRMAIVLPGFAPTTQSSLPPQMLERARAAGPRRDDVYRVLNDLRGNRSETAAVEFAVALVHTGRHADTMSWLFDAALQDGSAINAFWLSDIVFQGAQRALGSPGAPTDPARRAPFEETLDLGAALFLNSPILSIVDGAKCVDETAGDARAGQLLLARRETARLIAGLPPERRARIKRFAFALEESTAAARAPDPTTCRAGGVETIRAVSESWAANLPVDSPELERRGRRTPDGVLHVTVPATPERPDMYRPQSEFPAAVARAREQARRLLDQLIP